MFQPDFAQTAERLPAGMARLSGAAGLAAFHRRGAWRVGHAVRAAGTVSRRRGSSTPFLEGIAKLGLDRPGIPDLDRLNERLEPLTGWRCVSVPGLVPDDAFFAMLAERRFPIGNFIRSADSLDYLEEPDCFHDIFGHVPLLAHAPVARLMQAMGRLGVEAIAAGLGDTISRLYWHTVEFGLAREGGEVKILGAGLASSFGEAHFAIEADVPRPRFTLSDAAATAYRSDAFQPLYFVSDSLEEVAAELEAARSRRTAGALAG